MKHVVEMIVECGEGASIELCDHATSFLQGVASNILTICLIQVNESMYLGMVFCQLDDGFGNFVD
jgi:hypothetical protein